jgi:hypothetical protein
MLICYFPEQPTNFLIRKVEVIMKKTFVIFALLFVTFLSAQVSAQQTKNESPDKITILNISFSSPATRGVETEISVEVEYNFESDEEGMISIGFNTDKPNSYHMREKLNILKGVGTVTLKAKVIPVDWVEKGEFTLLTILTKKPTGNRFRPSASVKKVIEVGK